VFDLAHITLAKKSVFLSKFISTSMAMLVLAMLIGYRRGGKKVSYPTTIMKWELMVLSSSKRIVVPGRKVRL
jgi:hypothetical protein